MRSLSLVVLAAAVVSCRPMREQDEKSVDPAVQPATATAAPSHADADDVRARKAPAADPATRDPHAGLGEEVVVSSPGLGFMPDYGAAGEGVGVADVRPGGPADRAGLKAGDVIVRFAGIPVADVEEYMAALSTVKVGSKVDVVVKRDGKTLTLKSEVGVSRR